MNECFHSYAWFEFGYPGYGCAPFICLKKGCDKVVTPEDKKGYNRLMGELEKEQGWKKDSRYYA